MAAAAAAAADALVREAEEMDIAEAKAHYVPNLLGYLEDGWAINVCAKCIGRPETMTRTCDAEWYLKHCQRAESITAQKVCNQCASDRVGSVLPGRGFEKGNSFFRGTKMGSVEKRIRGIVPPNVDIVGHNLYGGLRYCGPPGTFNSITHYYSEENVMPTGTSCINDEAIFTNWDYKYQLPCAPRNGFELDELAQCSDNTKVDASGLRCKDPTDTHPTRGTCPLARRCAEGVGCERDEPDWTDTVALKRAWEKIGRKTNYGLWEWLDPGIDHGWSFIPDVSWGIVEWGIHPDKKK